QLPLYRKLPKRGFNNKFATVYATINVSDLNKFEDGATVNLEALINAGVINKELDGLKVLGNGELTKKLTVEAKVFSATAKEKIEAAGGKAEVK
ncbi:MAG: 50S ribosomal protein L15, partial [Clostridia bacterium]|nr:50S ribosomal protein L15 [Clostridia bacterium]